MGLSNLISIIGKVIELIPKGWMPFKQWLIPFIVSVMITGLLMGLMRPAGIMQRWELEAFDRLLRLRPEERPDTRLIIISIDQKDIEYQDREGMRRQGSLADRGLAQLLEKLKLHNPAVIGLDIHRDPPIVDPDAADLAAHLRDKYFGDRFIDVCQVGGGEQNSAEIPPPRGIPLKRVGFSDLPKDDDDVVRRQIFGMAPGTVGKCYTKESFSFRIARRYLTDRGFNFERVSRTVYRIGNRDFQKSEQHTGGYHDLNGGGFEVLLNYRSSDQVVPQVSLSEILDGSKDTELRDLVKDKIILIGTTDKSYKDYHLTPYSAAYKPLKKLPGVKVQAHMVSQIVSAIYEDRAVLLWLPQWGDFLFVWTWSFMGGIVLVWSLRSQRDLRLVVGSTAVIIVSLPILCYKICLHLLSQRGLWLPFVPAVLTWLSTAVVVVVLNKHVSNQAKAVGIESRNYE